MHCTEYLFSYGTLRYDRVQLSNFGRLLKGDNAVLSGYKISMLRITDPEVLKASGEEFHPVLQYTGVGDDKVEGMVFAITKEELQHADDYEVDDYQRVSVTLDSGRSAWVYVQA